MADKDDNRLARELDTRETDERDNVWQPAQLLPEPDKQPGFSYRWIRVSTLSVADPRNVSSKMREGWEPVSVEEQPHMQMLVEGETKLKGSIEIGGLVLCKIPTKRMDARALHFANKNRAQMEAVDNSLMRESDPRMPIFNEKKSTVSRSFGKGS